MPKEGGIALTEPTAQDSEAQEEESERVSIVLKGDRLTRLKNISAATGVPLTHLLNIGADSVIQTAEGLSTYYRDEDGGLIYKEAGRAYPARRYAKLRPGRPMQ